MSCIERVKQWTGAKESSCGEFFDRHVSQDLIGAMVLAVIVFAVWIGNKKE